MPEDTNAIDVLLRAMGIRTSQGIGDINLFRERRVDDFDIETQDVIFVDISAGHGHIVARPIAAIPSLPGPLVAQDLPSMITRASEAAGFGWQAYGFFTAQPIKHKTLAFIRIHMQQLTLNEKSEHIISAFVFTIGRATSVLKF
jgi:hypothetical protein